MSDLGRRIRRLEQIAPGVGATEVPIVDLPRWPAPDRAAFEQAEAAGDESTVADLVERHTGIRPGRGPGIRMVVTDVVERRAS